MRNLNAGGALPESFTVAVAPYDSRLDFVHLEFGIIEGEIALTGVRYWNQVATATADGGWIVEAAADLHPRDLVPVKARWVDAARALARRSASPFNIQTAPASTERRQGRTDADLAEVARLKAEGKSFAQIARVMDMSKATVARWHKEWQSEHPEEAERTS